MAVGSSFRWTGQSDRLLQQQLSGKSSNSVTVSRPSTNLEHLERLPLFNPQDL